jgi:hypothetical protein
MSRKFSFLPNRTRKDNALISLTLLFVYYSIDRWIPLGDWNLEHQWPVHNGQLTLDIVVIAVLIAAILAFYRKIRIGMVLATALLGLWCYFHLQSWWWPYLRGVTSARAIAFHSQFLKHTQVLPQFGNHFPPDAEHTFIDVFVFLAFAFCLTSTIKEFRGTPHHN